MLLAEKGRHAADVIRHYRQRPAEGLYDLKAGPWEQHNIADDPAYQGTLSELREELKEWRLRQGEDTGKVPMPEDARQGNVPYAK